MEPFFYLHTEIEHVNRCSRNQRPCTNLSIYGKDLASENVVVRVQEYRIHFYVSFRDNRLYVHCAEWLTQNNSDNLLVSLKTMTGYESMLMDWNHQTVHENNIVNTKLKNVLRIQVRTQRDIKTVIDRIDHQVYDYCVHVRSPEEYPSAVNYYESNLDIVITASRYLGLEACQWCSLNTDLCQSRNDTAFIGREYIFIDNGIRDPKKLFLTPHHDSPKLPPYLKILSFDIECLSSEVEKMPDATRDRIVQISSVVAEDALGRKSIKDEPFGQQSPTPVEPIHIFNRYLFTIDTCSAIEGVRTHSFGDEKELLEAFIEHIVNEDPDLLAGYNVAAFDLPYLFQRLELNGVRANFGRGRLPVRWYKRKNSELNTKFTPKALDTFTVPGRVIFDMYPHVRKEVKLRSYTLNSVSSYFLDSGKDDVSYKEIPILFNGDADSRARLGRYCVKDAQLVLEIAFRTQTFVHLFERCKVFRTMLSYMIDRGQQVKFYSMLLAYCSERKVLVDDLTTRRRLEENHKKRVTHTNTIDERLSSVNVGTAKRKRVGYEGATVLNPITGIYRTPVVCLDYASLYPSIMIAYNLCFTTYVRDKTLGGELVSRGLAEVSPIGHHFLTRPVRQGVIPFILEMLLFERADVRGRMLTVKEGSIEYKMLDGQQNALKLAANSMYGAIGCNTSSLNVVEIPSSVTAFGRQLITLTKQHVEGSYSGTEVVYGDTDSVMVNLYDWDSGEVKQIWNCLAIGKEMAASVTERIDRSPIRLQFETVYRPFLLCTKKRYAAGVYTGLEELAVTGETEPRQIRPTIKYKGLQVVRRDNCTFFTRLMRFTLESLMDESATLDESLDRVRLKLQDDLRNLFDGRIDISELVITKEWKKKGARAQAHDRLVQKLQERDPNSEPSIGDRIPYVVIVDPDGANLCDRAEDPSYVIEKGLPLDLLYYAENCIAKPIAELLMVVLPGKQSLQDVIDTFWPENAPRRRFDKRKRSGSKRWMKRAAIDNRQITEYFKVNK